MLLGTSISLVLVSTVPVDVYHLCVCPTLSTLSLFPLVTSSIQVPPGAGLPSLLWQGRELVIYLSSPYPAAGTTLGQGPWAAAALVPVQIPGTLPPQCHLLTLTICFSMSSAIFCYQTSYKLGFHWLFTLFLRRSARCPSWAQGELGSVPTYLAFIFLISFGL